MNVQELLRMDFFAREDILPLRCWSIAQKFSTKHTRCSHFSFRFWQIFVDDYGIIDPQSVVLSHLFDHIMHAHHCITQL